MLNESVTAAPPCQAYEPARPPPKNIVMGEMPIERQIHGITTGENPQETMAVLMP